MRRFSLSTSIYKVPSSSLSPDDIRFCLLDAQDLLEHISHAAAKEAGCVHTEGRGYAVQSGDVVLIKWK
jgi:ribosome-binding ATPase YchF (GTP1/OBG family)